MQFSEELRPLQTKYNITAWFYDFLDFPWELQYRHWRPGLLADVRGNVLEAGVGTGRNLPYYPAVASVTAIDLSRTMLHRAARRGRQAVCQLQLRQEDATTLQSIASGQFDWVISTFLCCVLPDEFQPMALKQFERILKPGGRFRLVEIVYSNDPRLRRRQKFFAPFVSLVYGARFDRHTLDHINRSPNLSVVSTRFLKHDTYLFIEGRRQK